MLMTEERTDLAIRVTVRCAGWLLIRGQQSLCRKTLARPRVEHWEEDMSSRAELECPKCGTVYTLADYLDSR